MSEVIKQLKSIIRKYKTSLELNSTFRFSNDDLESIRKAIRYLELVDSLAKQYKRSDKE